MRYNEKDNKCIFIFICKWRTDSQVGYHMVGDKIKCNKFFQSAVSVILWTKFQIVDYV